MLGGLGVGKAGKTGPAAQTFAPWHLFDLDPLLYGLAISFALGILVSLFTQPLPSKDVDTYFLASDQSP